MAYLLSYDDSQSSVCPSVKGPSPRMDFTSCRRGIHRLATSALDAVTDNPTVTVTKRCRSIGRQVIRRADRIQWQARHRSAGLQEWRERLGLCRFLLMVGSFYHYEKDEKRRVHITPTKQSIASCKNQSATSELNLPNSHVHFTFLLSWTFFRREHCHLASPARV